MNNIKRFLQIIGIITLSVFSASAAFAVSGPSGEYSKKGIVWESSISGLIHSPKASDSNKYRIETHWATLFGLGFHGSYMWDCRKKNQLKIKTSSDGKYTGLELAEDVLLVVTGTASGTIGGNSGTGVWDSQGVFSTSSQSLRPDVSWCGSVNKDVSYDTNDSATFDGKAMLYIGPRAQEETIKLPQLSLFKGLETEVNSEIALVSSSTFTIKDKLHCNIIAPPTINFGTINITTAKNGDLLKEENGDLLVSCTSTYNDTTASSLATINVTGPQGEYPESLKMTMDTGAVAPAEIRGFIGKNISKIGMCNGNTSYPGWIKFSDTKQAQNAGILKVGSNNTIPYSFSLCSNGGKARGNATAKAMIELVWE